jgi:hypothetical protein
MVAMLSSLKQNKFMSSSFLQKLAERAQVSVKEEKIESRRIAQRAQVSVKEAADSEKIECRRLSQRCCNAPTLWHTEA